MRFDNEDGLDMMRSHKLTHGLKRFWTGLAMAVVLFAATYLGAPKWSALTSAAVVHEPGLTDERPSAPEYDSSTFESPTSTRNSTPRVVENRMNEAAREAAEAVRSLGTGEASYYGAGFSGRPTASGERFDPSELTAAHRTLPFGSKVRVTNVKNGRTVVVRVNDRGPYADNRVIDLSRGAAERIGMVQSGTASVKLELIA